MQGTFYQDIVNVVKSHIAKNIQSYARIFLRKAFLIAHDSMMEASRVPLRSWEASFTMCNLIGKVNKSLVKNPNISRPLLPQKLYI